MFSLAFYKSADGMTWKKSSREKDECIIQHVKTKASLR